MKIQDHLDRTLETTGDMSLVAFGDATTGMILNWSARSQCPREVLDLLGEKAAAAFALIAEAGMPEDADPAIFGTEVILFTEGSSEVFVRAPGTAEDVVCAVGEPGAPIEPLLQVSGDLAVTIAEMS